MYKENNNDKNIYKNVSGNYTIYKSIKGKQYCFGTYHSIEEAREKREYYEANKWDITKLNIKRRGRKNEDRYIVEKNGKYKIIKHNPEIRQPETYETGIRTLEEARRIRDWWEENNWDWGAI